MNQKLAQNLRNSVSLSRSLLNCFASYSDFFQFFTYVLDVCPFRFLGTIFFVVFQQSDETGQYFPIFRHKPHYVN